MIYVLYSLILLYSVFVGLYLIGITGRKLTQDEINRLKENGISHYTTKENSKIILNEGFKARFKLQNLFLYHIKKVNYFLLGEPSIHDKRALQYNWKSYFTHNITVKQLTDEQIKNFLIRPIDKALIYKGNFPLLEVNEVVNTDISPIGKISAKEKLLWAVEISLRCAMVLVVFTITLGTIV